VARALRLDFAGATWHLHNRGNNRQDIFLCDRDRLQFLDFLAETIRRYKWIKDSRLRFRPLEKEALIAAKVRVFVFIGGNVPGAAMADAIVKAIPKVQALLGTKQHAFVARITAASDEAVLLEA
jgi:hypothetical protein